MTPDDVKNLTETLQMISHMTSEKPNEWLPLYAALGGAVAGAIASFFPTLLLERNRENKQSRRLLCSLVAEISALVEIIEHRNYRDAVKEIITHLKAKSLIVLIHLQSTSQNIIHVYIKKIAEV